MRLLDRYVLRNFLEPFLLCFAAFLGILLIFDLNDNLGDFIEAKAKWKQIGVYYLHQLPHFTLLSLPLGLLLALLYSLSKMSRSNEIISMLSSGRSVIRLLLPLFVCGIMATGGCLWLNYEHAPQSEALRTTDIERIKKGEKKAESRNELTAHLSRDRMTKRIWFIRRMRSADNQLDDVHITQLDADGEPATRWYAQNATFVPRDKKWVLNFGREVHLDKEGDVTGPIEDWSDPKKFTGALGSRSFNTWRETPYRLASSSMEAEQLSVPDLRRYIQFNSDFSTHQLAPFRTYLQHRWALPLTCFTVIFIAAPLGIVFSRRAVLASVASSLFIFFGYIFMMFLFLALGKGGHVPPIVAAWTPNAVLFIIGAYLLFLRSTNREMPRLFSRN